MLAFLYSVFRLYVVCLFVRIGCALGRVTELKMICAGAEDKALTKAYQHIRRYGIDGSDLII